MKTPSSLESLSSRPKLPRLPMALRAAVAGVLLAGANAQAIEPRESVLVAMAPGKKAQGPEEAKSEAFAAALREIGQSKDVAQRKNLWVRLALAQPAMILQYSELVDAPLLMETLGVACGALADKEPDVFLEKALDCTDLPNYRDLVIKAAKNAAGVRPEAAMAFRERFETFPGGREIIRVAMANMRKKAAGGVTKKPSGNP